jgi:Transposase
VTMIDAQRTEPKLEVILGVDTHLDVHVAVVVDQLGRRLGELSVPTTAKGYERLLCWLEGFGPVRCAGIEGTSSYGAGLARYFKAQGIEVLEVERPKRRQRSSPRNAKSDPSDAESAARAVLAGETSGVPKSAEGCVEMIRALRAARRSAMKARTQAANQLQGLRVTAPEQLRHRLRGLSTNFFTEDVCFHTSTEGEGGSVLWRSPILRRLAQASLAALGWGRAKAALQEDGGGARQVVRPGVKPMWGTDPSPASGIRHYFTSLLSSAHLPSPPTHTMFSRTCCMSTSKSLRPGPPARGCPYKKSNVRLLLPQPLVYAATRGRK